MQKPYSRDIEAAAIVAQTARINNVSKRYVKMVIEGDRQNEGVLDTYMLLKEGTAALLNQACQINRQLRKHAC